MFHRRFYYWILSFLLSITLFVRIFLTFFRRLNADEFQHLHASWMVHLGLLPYRDFWENHSPLLYFLLAPVLAFFGEGISAVLAARVILSATGLGIAILVYLIARLDHSKETSLLALVVLSFSEIFLQKTIEVRTDQLLILFWLISLYFCFRSFPAKRVSLLLAAGLSLGIGMLFSPKALLCFTSAAILITVQDPSRLARIAKRLIYFSLGFLVPIVPLALYFYAQNAHPLLIESTLLQNLSYPDTRGPSFLLLPQNLGFLLLAFAGIYLSVSDREHRKAALYRTRSLLLVPGLFLLGLLIFVLPATFSQSALTFVPILALYAGIAWQKSVAWQSRFTIRNFLLLSFTLTTALIIPVTVLFLRNSFAITNTEQFDRIRYILKNTKQGEEIFDGNASYIFRPQTYYYGALVEGIRYKIDRGEIRDSIIDALKEHSCRIVIYDDRVSDLPEPVQNFIRANYLPVGQFEIFVAGKELSAENLSHNRAAFWIELPLVYSIHAGKDVSLKVDGKPYQTPVFLDRGEHHLVSDKVLQRVTILATK
ncbi:glycosyltransferase family 39 protein [bacterium]|nr:glycosyltransferase family 39 protein [bacterium]MCI0603983.1 glycosyltransferase family 39 protein [bacterium]